MADLAIKDLTTVIASGITAIATLSAVVIANLFNARITRANVESAERQKRLDFRLSKLEEFYLLFERWEMAFVQVCLFHYRGYLGELSFRQVLDLTQSDKTLAPGEFQKLMMLMRIHFRQFIVDHEEVEAARRNAARFLHDPARTRLTADEFFAAQQRFDAACAIFKEKIATNARALDGS
ncbi:hypothetical protein ACMX25_12420 [Caballeronia sp. 15715]|uniref:hypothetical protein n=1 Tax=Caballeronia sp. 15715 TaxID=3391030 RepID=UPI0039E30C0B